MTTNIGFGEMIYNSLLDGGQLRQFCHPLDVNIFGTCQQNL